MKQNNKNFCLFLLSVKPSFYLFKLIYVIEQIMIFNLPRTS